jgi:hypothetical protein
VDRLGSIFADLEDPRTGNARRHDLHEILMIALCTVLCGGEDCSDMARFGHAKRDFLQEFLTLEHGIPSHDTFSRVFRRLDPIQFQACFLAVRMRDVLGGCDDLQGLRQGAWIGRFITRIREGWHCCKARSDDLLGGGPLEHPLAA